MKINRTKQRRVNKLLYPFLIVVLIIGIAVTTAYALHSWPFNSPADESNNGTDSSKDNDTNSGTENTQSGSTDDTKTQDTPTTDNPVDNDQGYIDTPIEDKPSNSAAYPIENSHYKITQISSDRYEITLYPIANNPEYSNYDAQLKAYKNEALNYLTGRYGSIDKFSINWSPDEAKNI